MTAIALAGRFIGVKETAGVASTPLVLAMLQLDGAWPKDDAVPWCSAFVNYVCWLMDLPRSKSLAARSWVRIGTPILLRDARSGFDIVVLNRGGSPAPDDAGPGHVGFFVEYDSAAERVLVLGGNQQNSVNMQWFPARDVLAVRRLAFGNV